VKATAIAHPIQGLVKYHGLADPILRLPFHDSISVCTAPLTTRTTVEFGEAPSDSAVIDGRPVTVREMERAARKTEQRSSPKRCPSRRVTDCRMSV